MLSYHSYSCAQRTWGCVAYRGIWDRVTHCVAWKAVSNVSWVYGLIHLTHSCIPVYSICSAHSPPHICLQCSFYIAAVHRSKQYKCNELTWMMVSWHITWGAPGCLLSTGCAMAMNIMRRVFLQLKIQFLLWAWIFHLGCLEPRICVLGRPLQHLGNKV